MSKNTVDDVTLSLPIPQSNAPKEIRQFPNTLRHDLLSYADTAAVKESPVSTPPAIMNDVRTDTEHHIRPSCLLGPAVHAGNQSDIDKFIQGAEQAYAAQKNHHEPRIISVLRQIKKRRRFKMQPPLVKEFSRGLQQPELQQENPRPEFENDFFAAGGGQNPRTKAEQENGQSIQISNGQCLRCRGIKPKCKNCRIRVPSEADITSVQIAYDQIQLEDTSHDVGDRTNSNFVEFLNNEEDDLKALLDSSHPSEDLVKGQTPSYLDKLLIYQSSSGGFRYYFLYGSSTTGLNIGRGSWPTDMTPHYCPIRGCIHSAAPRLCDIGSAIAKKIYDSETSKLHLLIGLSPPELEAHFLEAHEIAPSDSRLEDFLPILVDRPKPVFAEQRRFIFSSELFPSACGWLIRARSGDEIFSDWSGVDYDAVAASGFQPWNHTSRFNESHARNSVVHFDGILGRSADSMLNSEISMDMLLGETRHDQEDSIENCPFSVIGGKKPRNAISVESEALHQDLPSKGKDHSVRASDPCSSIEGQGPISRFLKSSRAERGPDEQIPATIQSPSYEGSPYRQHEPPDHDPSGDVSVIASVKRRILESIMNEFTNIFYGSAPERLRCQSERSQSSSLYDDTKQSSNLETGSKHSSSISSGKRRAEDRNPPSGDEDDGHRKRRKKSVPVSHTTARARLLACPFNKHDPKIYGPCNEGQGMAHKFRTCAGPGWPTVARLKEHLYRVHPTPIHCARCWLTTKTDKDLEEHVRSQVPCLVQPQLVQWVSREKIEVLKDRKKVLPSQTEEDRWKSVYEILFPDDLVLPSAYYDNHEQCAQDENSLSPSSRGFAAFEHYLQENLPTRVRQAFEAMLDEQMLPIKESLKRALPEVVRTCQAQMFRDWEQLSSGAGQTTTEGPSTKDPQTAGAASPGNNCGPGPFASPSWNEFLSNFFIEPGPALIDNPFEHPVQFNDNGEGPSRTTIEDSGYHSLQDSDIHPPKPSDSPTLPAATDDASAHWFQDEGLGDLGLADPDLHPLFDWSEFELDRGD